MSNLDMPLITLITVKNSFFIDVKFRYAANYSSHSKFKKVCVGVLFR